MSVSKGEVFLVHLRTSGDGCVNELEEDLNAATAPHSAKGIRDLWSENTAARLNDSSDVIILRNSISDKLLDAFMYAVEDEVEWKKGRSELARAAVEAGIYSTGDISEAVLNVKTSPLKSFSRLDANDIRSLALSGQPYEYPVRAAVDNWVVKETSPGTL